MLSEKAKGKQRALVPLDQDEQSTASTSTSAQVPQAKSLVIRFTEGIPDLTLEVSEKDAVRDVKRNIRNARPQLKDRRLRLIHSGRLLTDGTFLYSWLVSLEERQRRAHVEGGSEDSAGTTWLHCSVGPIMAPGEEEETKEQQTQLKPLRGFDRLAAAGFSEQDIANIRSQFHAHSSGDYLDQSFNSGEDLDEHARALEEQWIDSIDNPANASLSQSPSSGTSALLTGIIMGFFFPLIPYFFFYESKPAVFLDNGIQHEVAVSPIFPKRLQMGIVIGFAMNVIFGGWVYLLATA